MKDIKYVKSSKIFSTHSVVLNQYQTVFNSTNLQRRFKIIKVQKLILFHGRAIF